MRILEDSVTLISVFFRNRFILLAANWPRRAFTSNANSDNSSLINKIITLFKSLFKYQQNEKKEDQPPNLNIHFY